MIILPTEKSLDWQRAPLVLCAIVLINILVFFFYQTGDDAKFMRGLESYQSSGLLEFEQPYFERYLTEQGDTESLQAFRELQREVAEELLDPSALSVEILLRVDFYRHLKVHYPEYMSYEDHEDWAPVREAISDEIESISSIAWGLKPADISLATLITSQFLHGDVMHLLGNMFFLVMCGFAVEAALGHRLFLVFYLLTGMAGDLMHSLFNPGDMTPLIGASGAISGVMAMYLGVFRLKKIEFFYWFFVFVGYFRAPALAVLPFYIGKEFYSFYTDDFSNVAFMAHAGGFVLGAVLMVVLFRFNPDLLDQEYIEEDQDADPYREALAKVMVSLERFQFDSAKRQVDQMVKDYGLDFRLAKLRYQISKMNGGREHTLDVLRLLVQKNLSVPEIRALAKVLDSNPVVVKHLKPQQLMGLGLQLVQLEDLSYAESVFVRLESGEFDPPRYMDVLASKLSQSFKALKYGKKSLHYAEKAEQLMKVVP